MIEIAWIIPVLPLLSFVLILLFGRRLKTGSATVGILMTFLSFVFALIVLFEQLGGATAKVEVNWLPIGDTVLTMGFLINPLNALMLALVTLISFLIHVYSKGYMADDSRIDTFFAYLGLFTFSMLALVMSPNLLQLYIFWELVGVCSFLLIGFYFFKSEARAAAKKAFIVTRIGDVALFVGMILLFWQVGSFQYDEIFAAVDSGALTTEWITLTAILIFVGAVGKSGQFPLHTWLPDAMEGPSPVSALIHAATMVAAGVYLVATMYPLYLASDTAMTTVAVVGGFTAIFAASIALVQTDIKRILAYSTVSQLGYMMLALGVGGYVAGVFHLVTHAFFKALLFLAAGSVIHAAGTQNIEKMGGLWKKLKVTAPLFLVGSLAISGVPLFSGFFSKDEILLATDQDGQMLLFWLAVIAAFFTAFYMFRLFFLVFFGKPKEDRGELHESPPSMTIPMMGLAVFAIFIGYINTTWFGAFLGDWLTAVPYNVGETHHEGSLWVMVITTGVSLFGIYFAWLIYGREKIARDWLSGRISGGYQLLYRKYFIDELYERTIVLGNFAFSTFLKYFDQFIIEALVHLTVEMTQGIGRVTRRLQSGQVQTYGMVAFLGVVVVIVIMAVTGGYFQ
jgi:NADH-quinone oxidoreductase subunit L